LFAPITAVGGPVTAKHIQGYDALRDFLAERLKVRPSAIEDESQELVTSGHASIYPVQLTTREIKKLGLS
jgi:hypothetical protein